MIVGVMTGRVVIVGVAVGGAGACVTIARPPQETSRNVKKPTTRRTGRI